MGGGRKRLHLEDYGLEVKGVWLMECGAVVVCTFEVRRERCSEEGSEVTTSEV